MAIKTKNVSKEIAAFEEKVRGFANAQFESPQYRRVLGMRLSKERAQRYTLQKAFWNLNRRDCWAFAQGLAPMDVKGLIWEHESDELAGNAERGVEDHYSLQVRQSALIGLTLEDFQSEIMADATRTCLYAYIHLVKDSPWLKSVAACAALEVSNSSAYVDGGGMSFRMGKRFEEDLGIPFKKMVNAAEHAEVDVEHANLLIQVAVRHADTAEKLDLMMEGLQDSWALDRTWKGMLADMMSELPDPA
jgi:pyrroloquinoline quinone (PQQ) biosynthesis protein C